MPKVGLHFNISRDCCLKYKGEGPHDPQVREGLMRPFAEEFARKQEELHPGWTIELVADELAEGDPRLCGLYACQVRVVFGGLTGTGVGIEEWMCDALTEANCDQTAFLAADPSTIDAMSPEDVDVLRRLSRIGLPDPVRMMCVLDAVLMKVDEVASISPLHIFVRIGLGVCVDSTAGNVKLLGDDECQPCGMVISLLPSVTVGAIVHEAAHVLNYCRGEVEAGEGCQFTDALSEVLNLLEPECIEWMENLPSAGTPETRASPGFPDLLDGVLWRMRIGGEVVCATWCEDGAECWGRGLANVGCLLRDLPPEEAEFALRSITCGDGEFD